MIPSFAIERTQELLYDLNEFVEKNFMPKMNVYLDSPMAIKATEVFKKHPEYYNPEVMGLLNSGDNPFHLPGLIYTPTVDESKRIKQEKSRQTFQEWVDNLKARADIMIDQTLM